ncbi:Protein of unknown function [Evansella caseinilytica]|uniref:Uncharacterized protein n=1 Tax=Evansella caseinilytica TaxID=1503961 RepID=A0A1H3TSF6_9BACI|nr:DUF3958 family protein [Evansella caseinilytica]SDZ53164.1 Protein of unknown function [Evansella caseinilytica]
MKKEDERLQIKTQLRQLADEQTENRHAFARYEQDEQTLFEIQQKNRRLFDNLFYSWNKDRQLLNQLEQQHNELFDHQQKLREELENKKDCILQENKRLNNVEDNLYRDLRSLEKEGKS